MGGWVGVPDTTPRGKFAVCECDLGLTASVNVIHSCRAPRDDFVTSVARCKNY